MIKNETMERKKEKTGRKRNGGFTVVETLVAASIIVILLAIGMAGVLRYRDYLRITELDNMARSIYMAAQNRAVLLDNDERFQTLVTKGTPQADGTLGGGCTEITVTDPVSGEDKIRWYIDSENPATAAALDDLLPLGAIDPALQNGRFYIVYEPGSASVTDVFYVEKQDYDLETFESGAGIAAALEILGADDKRDNRMTNKPVMVGWFGSNGAAGHDAEIGEPRVMVDIHNGDELAVTVTYEYTRLNDSPEVEAKTSVKLKYGTADPVMLAEGEGGWSASLLSGWILLSESEAPGLIPDSTTYTYKYRKVLDSLVSGVKFHELSIPGVSDYGNDFTVTATLQLYEKDNKDNMSGIAEGEDTDNSLFAADTHDSATAYIANLRHLQNLDSDYSMAGGKTEAIQTENIDASKLFKLRDFQDGYNYEEVTEKKYEFKPIQNKDLLSYRAMKDENAADESEEGAFVPLHIEKLNVTEASSDGKDGAGLFGKTEKDSEGNGFTFQDVRLMDPAVTVKGKDTGALVGSADKVSLENCQVVNTDSNKSITSENGIAGGLTGTAEDASFTNCQVLGVWITGNTVGGLAGSMEAAEFVDCIVADDTLKNQVDGTVCAGGMVGNATGECLFQGCQVSGTQVDGKGEESIAGGLAGSTKGARFESYTAADGTVKNCTAEDVTVGAKKYAGGIAGYNEGNIVSFENCQVTLTKVTSTNGIAGGLAGADNGTHNADFENCGIENLMVVSMYNAAGGMLGCKSLGSVTFNSCTVEKEESSNIAHNNAELNGVAINGGSNAGGLLGYTEGDGAKAAFTNCTVGKDGGESILTVTATRYAGGLAGDSAGGLFENCRVYNAVVSGTGSEGRAGGLAGNTSADKFTDCIVGEGGEVTVTATMYAGGLAGTSNVGPFLGCRVVNAEVTCSAGGSVAGGLAGDTGATEFGDYTAADGTAKKCAVENVIVTAGYIAGGMSGNCWGSNSFTNCQVVNATVTCEDGWSFAGGILGFNWGAGGVGFKSCTVEGLTVKAFNHVGGLMGCKSQGNVTFDSSTVGMDEKGDIAITSSDNAGGLLGCADQSDAAFSQCKVGGGEKVNISGNVAGGLTGNTQTGKAHFIGCSVVGKIDPENNASNFTVSGVSYIGALAGKTETDTFELCTVEDVKVDLTGWGGCYAGGLTGLSENSSFSGCTVSGGMVTTHDNVLNEIGGLAGSTTNVSFSDCVAKNIIVTGGTSAGGLVGRPVESRFENCTAEWEDNKSNTVKTRDYAGGLAGNAIGSSFKGCMIIKVNVESTGDAGVAGGLAARTSENVTIDGCKSIDARVKAASYAGGLLGEMINTTLSGCQVYLENDIGNSTTDYRVIAKASGGLAGMITDEGTIQQSFAATLVQGTTYAGGLAGALSVPKDDDGNPVSPDHHPQVNIETSYADCYLTVGGGTEPPYAGGLVGLKDVLVNLTMKNVYAAGFITMDGAETKTAAGLCSGYASTEEDKSDMNPADVTNAYAAMYYSDVDRIQPLADEVAADEAQKRYYLNYSAASGGKTYAQMRGINMGDKFTMQSEAGTHSYGLSGNASAENVYSFPGLAGLDHYGDWVSSSLPDVMAIQEENSEILQEENLQAVQRETPAEAPEDSALPGDGEALGGEENPGTDGTQPPAETPEDNTLSGDGEAPGEEENSETGGTQPPAETPEDSALPGDGEAPGEEENLETGGTQPPAETPEDSALPGDGEALEGEENSGTGGTENPAETTGEASENGNISLPQQQEAIVPSENNDVSGDTDDGSSQDGTDPVSKGGDTP